MLRPPLRQGSAVLVDSAPCPVLGRNSLLGRPGPHITGSGHPPGRTPPTATSSEAHVGHGIQTGTWCTAGRGTEALPPTEPEGLAWPRGPAGPGHRHHTGVSPCFIFSSWQRTRTCVPDRVVAARDVLWEQEGRGPLSDIFQLCRTNLSRLW